MEGLSGRGRTIPWGKRYLRWGSKWRSHGDLGLRFPKQIIKLRETHMQRNQVAASEGVWLFSITYGQDKCKFQLGFHPSQLPWPQLSPQPATLSKSTGEQAAWPGNILACVLSAPLSGPWEKGQNYKEVLQETTVPPPAVPPPSVPRGPHKRKAP